MSVRNKKKTDWVAKTLYYNDRDGRTLHCRTHYTPEAARNFWNRKEYQYLIDNGWTEEVWQQDRNGNILRSNLPAFDVTITAKVTKTLRVYAPDKDAAAEVAHEKFTVACDGPDENYEQETQYIEAVI